MADRERKLTLEQRQRLLKMFEDKVPQTSIARILNCSQATVSYHVRRFMGTSKGTRVVRGASFNVEGALSHLDNAIEASENSVRALKALKATLAISAVNTTTTLRARDILGYDAKGVPWTRADEDRVVALNHQADVYEQEHPDYESVPAERKEIVNLWAQITKLEKRQYEATVMNTPEEKAELAALETEMTGEDALDEEEDEVDEEFYDQMLAALR